MLGSTSSSACREKSAWYLLIRISSESFSSAASAVSRWTLTMSGAALIAILCSASGVFSIGRSPLIKIMPSTAAHLGAMALAHSVDLPPISWPCTNHHWSNAVSASKCSRARRTCSCTPAPHPRHYWQTIPHQKSKQYSKLNLKSVNCVKI